jgi:serine/threonine protein kinase
MREFQSLKLIDFRPSSHLVPAIHKNSKLAVSLKIIDKVGLGHKTLYEIRDEIQMYRHAAHYGVVRMLDYFENKHKFYVVFEEMSKLTLSDYIKKFKYIDEYRIKSVALKLGQTLEYLHDKGIVIRNLDANGILMTDETESGAPRIFDLEQAKVIGVDEITRGLFGDIRYKSPEIVECKPYNQKADIWAYGVILF